MFVFQIRVKELADTAEVLYRQIRQAGLTRLTCCRLCKLMESLTIVPEKPSNMSALMPVERLNLKTG